MERSPLASPDRQRGLCPGIEPASPALQADSLPTDSLGKFFFYQPVP